MKTIPIPWWGKIVAKIVLSRVPLPYEVWRRVNVFRHGSMLRPDYAYRLVTHHINQTDTLRPGFVALELGPGDSVFSALIVAAAGASTSYLVDAGAFARLDV